MIGLLGWLMVRNLSWVTFMNQWISPKRPSKKNIKMMRQNMSLRDIINERWDRQLHSPLHVFGYFLNLAYFYDKTKFSKDGEVGQGLVTCIEKMNLDQEVQSCIIS